MVYFLPASFLYCSETHKMALPIQAVIHELSEEVMNFHQLTSFHDVPPDIFQPWDDWENKFEKLPQVCTLCFSVLWINVLDPSGRVLLPTLPSFTYVLGYWTASLKRNTEWSGQETTSRGRFYSTLGTFQISILGCSTDFIYNHEELRSRSSLNFPREIKWSKNTNR